MPIKAVIFDLNGVVMDAPKKLSDKFLERFNIPVEIFLPVLQAVMDQLRRPGAKNAYHAWKEYLEKWGIKFSEQEFFKFWFGDEKPKEGMIDLINDLRQRGIKTFILSNNFAERTRYYNEHFPEMEKLFDKMYFSWETGFIKPDPRAWQLILDQNNLDPSEVIYFDDSPRNVETAKSLGIKAYVFTITKEMKKVLNNSLQNT